jgi:hypothetical protein
MNRRRLRHALVGCGVCGKERGRGCGSKTMDCAVYLRTRWFFEMSERRCWVGRGRRNRRSSRVMCGIADCCRTSDGYTLFAHGDGRRGWLAEWRTRCLCLLDSCWCLKWVHPLRSTTAARSSIPSYLIDLESRYPSHIPSHLVHFRMPLSRNIDSATQRRMATIR